MCGLFRMTAEGNGISAVIYSTQSFKFHLPRILLPKSSLPLHPPCPCRILAPEVPAPSKVEVFEFVSWLFLPPPPELVLCGRSSHSTLNRVIHVEQEGHSVTLVLVLHNIFKFLSEDVNLSNSFLSQAYFMVRSFMTGAPRHVLGRNSQGRWDGGGMLNARG